MSEDQTIPDWLLERYLLSELTETQLVRVREAFERDPSLRVRLAALESDSEALLAAHPPRAVAASIRARAAGERARRVFRPLLVAAPALLVLAAVGLWRTPAPAPAVREVRVKGLRPQLLVFRRSGAGVEPLAKGARAREGDVVQLAYQAAGERYGAIVSVDGRGVVTSHLPRNESQAARLAAGSAVTLETAYRLDDAPRFEAFYFVTASQPFALAPVVAAAHVSASAADAPESALALPANMRQTAFVLRKDEHR